MADRGAQTGGSAGGNSGGRGPSMPLGVGSQTLKGAGLIAAAVIVGIILLQIIDPGNSGPVAASSNTTTKPNTTTTTTKPSTGKTTTTTAKARAAQKTPAQVHLIVLNAGAPSGSAASVSTTLKGKGYTNQGPPGNSATHITGTTVLCRAGLSREAAALATALGAGTKTAALAPPYPPGTGNYDCAVLYGAG